MGIERKLMMGFEAKPLLTCKKSPQTWGLKANSKTCLRNGLETLQKESPNMGIERLLHSPSNQLQNPACKKSPQTWGLKVQYPRERFVLVLVGLQKESPNMGIERQTANTWRWGGDRLQKESPNMGIESFSPIRRATTRNLACKKSPQTWGLKVQAVFVRATRSVVLAKRVPKHGDWKKWKGRGEKWGVQPLAKRVPKHGDWKLTHELFHQVGFSLLAKRVPKHGDWKPPPRQATTRLRRLACKKSPQTWGLKAPPTTPYNASNSLLAKRVPKHGDWK